MDVDTAVKLAHKALETTWGLNAGGAQRAAMLRKLGDLMYDHREELAAIEALDNGAAFTHGCASATDSQCTGKTFGWALDVDITFSTDTIKYYAGWADKISGQTIETDEKKLCYTRHEPIGIVVSIV